MIGYAIAVRRQDGSLFFSMPARGFATPIFCTHSAALEVARDYRPRGLDAVVVKVEYQEPTVLGPKRHMGKFE